MNSQNQSQAQNYNRNVPQQASHTVIFNDQPRATVDHSGNYPFLQQNNITNNHHTRNQPPFSEDEDYCSQTQQRFSTNQQNSNWKMINQILFINQIFWNHIHEMKKHDKQDKTQHHITINFQSQNLLNTQNPTQTGRVYI